MLVMNTVIVNDESDDYLIMSLAHFVHSSYCNKRETVAYCSYVYSNSSS